MLSFLLFDMPAPWISTKHRYYLTQAAGLAPTLVGFGLCRPLGDREFSNKCFNCRIMGLPRASD